MRALFLTSLMATLALAGCFGGGSSDAPISDGAYNLTHFGIPAEATAGEPFSFSMSITGQVPLADHGDAVEVDGVYYAEDTTTPQADYARRAGECSAKQGDDPTSFTVTCTLPAPGTYSVYGHLYIDHKEGNFNWFSRSFGGALEDYLVRVS